MKFKILTYTISVILIFLSCSSKKDIFYLQNYDTSYDISYDVYTVDIDDILKIEINSENPEAVLPYNPKYLSNAATNKDILLYDGFQINSDGVIFSHSLGKVKVVGLTLTEIRKKIYDLLVEGGYLTNPSVDVKLLNSSFTLLGEVNKPGRYDFIKNNLNIFEALGMAGDLTINAVRNDVKIIRTLNKEKAVNSIDLTSSELLGSEFFQVKPGDIIIVNPNTARIKNAGVIGNASNLLTLLSFILSSIILITNS